MTFEGTQSQEFNQTAAAELFDPSVETWDSVREQILRIEELCFGQMGFGEDELRGTFENPENIVVVLRKNKKIIGFSSAIPDGETEGAIYIDTTDVLPIEQGKGHLGTIMKLLEDEARKRGYKFLTRNAAVDNGYAEKILSHYAERIVDTYENESEYGRQRYFKIRL